MLGPASWSAPCNDLTPSASSPRLATSTTQGVTYLPKHTRACDGCTEWRTVWVCPAALAIIDTQRLARAGAAQERRQGAVGALTEHWSGNPCGRTAKSTPCTSKAPRGDLQLSPPSDNIRSLLRNRIGQGLLPKSCWLINFQPRCQYEARTLTLLRSCTCQMLRSAQNKTAEAAQCIAACTCTAFHKSTCPMTSLSTGCCVQRIPVTRAIFTVKSKGVTCGADLDHVVKCAHVVYCANL